MKKKKEYPRKRKRFIKKIFYLSLFVLFVMIIAIGTAAAYIVEKLNRPLYISPLPLSHSLNGVQQGEIYSELQDGLTKDHIEYTSIVQQNDSYVVSLQNNGKVTFSTQKDIMSQIASLQYILSHLTMEGRQFDTLDLRFDKPVIVLKP